MQSLYPLMDRVDADWRHCYYCHTYTPCLTQLTINYVPFFTPVPMWFCGECLESLKRGDPQSILPAMRKRLTDVLGIETLTNFGLPSMEVPS